MFNRFGKFLFKKRSVTPLPFIVVFPFIFGKAPLLFPVEDPFWLLVICSVFIIYGEAVRMGAVSYIGSISRTRGTATGNLIVDGPYALCRNPLYAGNFFIFAGFVFTANNIIYIAAALILFFIQYLYIIKFEEEVLREKFGETYLVYKRSVPSIFPRPEAVFKLENYRGFNAGRAIKSERWTLIAVLLFIAIPFICYYYSRVLPSPFDRVLEIITGIFS